MQRLIFERQIGPDRTGPLKNKNLGLIWNMEYEGRRVNDNENRKREIGLTE